MKKNLPLLFLLLNLNSKADSWTQKADFGGNTRDRAIGFSIGNKGYIGLGISTTNDFWEYDPSTNVWTQKANFGGLNKNSGVGFSIGNKGYAGTGEDGLNMTTGDFWQYDPATNSWLQRASLGTTKVGATGFSIGTKGYIGMGMGPTFNITKDLWEYDSMNDSWTQKASLPSAGSSRISACGFSIGSKGYIGTGSGNLGGTQVLNDFWEYDPAANVWTQKANFGGSARYFASCFSNGTKGYICLGGTNSGSTLFNDLWEYNPLTDSWLQKASFNGDSRFAAPGFAIGIKGYIGTGSNSFNNPFIHYKDFWEYTPCVPPTPTITYTGSTTFCNGGSILLNVSVGTVLTYQWKNNGNNIPGATSSNYTATTSGSYAVFVTSSCDSATAAAVVITVNQLPSATVTPSGPTTFCSGGSVVLNAPSATNRAYQWKKGANLISGATLSSYTTTIGGNYKVIVTNTVTGCSKTTSNATVVTVNALPTAIITPQGPTTFCAGGSVVLSANTGAGLTYKWKKGSNFISGATLSNYTATVGGNYKVQVTNSNGCSKTSGNVVVSVPCKSDGSESEGERESRFDVKVFPNPSSGDFVFEILNTANEKKSIDIYDMIGNLVLSKTVSNSEFTIHDSQLSNGIYTALITNGKNKKTLKLIKTN